MINIISISGLRKSGKTLLANTICTLDSRFKKISWATPLKDEFAREFEIERELLDHPTEKEQYRRDMQLHGDIRVEKNPRHYVELLIPTLKDGEYYVCDDTRKIEELESFMKLKAIPIGIYCDPYRRAERGWKHDPVIDNHWSEIELGTLSAYTWSCLGGEGFNNSGSMDSLKEFAYKFLKKHFPYTLEEAYALGKGNLL